MVYAADSKSAARKGLRVQVSSPALKESFEIPSARAPTGDVAAGGAGTRRTFQARLQAWGSQVE